MRRPLDVNLNRRIPDGSQEKCHDSVFIGDNHCQRNSGTHAGRCPVALGEAAGRTSAAGVNWTLQQGGDQPQVRLMAVVGSAGYMGNPAPSPWPQAPHDQAAHCFIGPSTHHFLAHFTLALARLPVPKTHQPHLSPHGLHSCSFFCLECFSPRYLQGSVPPFLRFLLKWHFVRESFPGHSYEIASPSPSLHLPPPYLMVFLPFWHITYLFLVWLCTTEGSSLAGGTVLCLSLTHREPLNCFQLNNWINLNLLLCSNEFVYQCTHVSIQQVYQLSTTIQGLKIQQSVRCMTHSFYLHPSQSSIRLRCLLHYDVAIASVWWLAQTFKYF